MAVEQLSGWMQPILSFAEANRGWAPVVVFAFAFAESLAFLSLLVPSSAIIVALSLIFVKAGLPLQPLVIAGGIGASLGYAVSYWLGMHYRDQVLNVWPFRGNPQMIERGEAFFRKWGQAGVFFGHFFGPVRAVIPVIAGANRMPELQFQLANVTSGFLWAIVVIVFPQQAPEAGEKLWSRFRY
jgi:membrane protein DedA with SNARE-associated domain